MSNYKSSHKAIGQDISERQRLFEQPSRKELILKSHKTDIEHMYDINNLPEAIMIEVTKAGLQDRIYTITKGKSMLWSTHNCENHIDDLLSFIRRYGTINVRDGEMMKPVTLKGKPKR